MIRAVFFDFYGVWLPDIFQQYLSEAYQQRGGQVAGELEQVFGQYFQGAIGAQDLASTLRYKLSRPDIDTAQFVLNETSISPAIVSFMRELHEHFLKLGVLANLGTQEYKLLSDFNAHNQVFEVIAGPLPFHLNAPLLSNEVFAQALQTIGEPPRSSLVVTANQQYQAFAQNLGMTVIPFAGFPTLKQTIEQLLSSEMA